MIISGQLDRHSKIPGYPIKERGATTVEYAVITILIVLTVAATVLFLANPADQNSLLPSTYTTVGQKVGNFGATNIATN